MINNQYECTFVLEYRSRGFDDYTLKGFLYMTYEKQELIRLIEKASEGSEQALSELCDKLRLVGAYAHNE